MNTLLLELVRTFFPNVKKIYFGPTAVLVNSKVAMSFKILHMLTQSLQLSGIIVKAMMGKGAADVIGGCVNQKVFKHVKLCKIILPNAEQVANYANDFVNGVDVIYYGTTKCSYILNSEDATNFTGTRKVWMIKRKVTEGTFDLHFTRHSADDQAFTTVFYIILKLVKANEHNTNILSSKAIQLVPGSW